MTTEKNSWLDLGDALFLLGIVSLELGVSLWSIPAALVVFALVCFLLVFFQKWTKKAEGARR